MEFWGVEVKAGQSLKVKPTFDNIIHLSQASLGESKKEKSHESVPLYVKCGDNKLVLGTLIPSKIPQLSFDLVFEKEFELSHNWKNGSIYFCGYQTPLPLDSSDEFDMEDSDEEGEEELPAVPARENGKAGPKAEKVKAAAPKVNAAKPAIPVKDVKPEQDDDDESDEEDDSDDEMIDGDDSDEISVEDESSDDDDEDDSEDEDSDEEEEKPKKAQLGKKRPTELETKTPVPAKKAKTPVTDGKKGGHVATPYPSKGAKTPNAKTQTPKSGGQHTCSSCSKTFNSDNALQSHTKAKHSGK